MFTNQGKAKARREAVVRFLEEHGPATAYDIQLGIRLGGQALSDALLRLLQHGRVEMVRGVERGRNRARWEWRLPGKGLTRGGDGE